MLSRDQALSIRRTVELRGVQYVAQIQQLSRGQRDDQFGSYQVAIVEETTGVAYIVTKPGPLNWPQITQHCRNRLNYTVYAKVLGNDLWGRIDTRVNHNDAKELGRATQKQYPSSLVRILKTDNLTGQTELYKTLLKGRWV